MVIKDDVRVIEFVKNIAENFPLANGGSLTAAQFLELFLFTPDAQYTYISKLSGGVKRRLHLLSILFRSPNFLILDEPTNDLDLPTLSVLENFLSEFGGCLLIVSHDRYFMDKLVDHLLVFEGDGVVSDFPGNYSEYRIKVDQKNVKTPAPKAVEIAQPASTNNTKKLGFKEKKEFDTLEKEIATLNKEKEQLTSKISDPALPFDQIQAVSARIGEITALVDEKELRWLELSELMISS